MSRKIKHHHPIITDSNQVSFAKVSPADFRKENSIADPSFA
jgi:hypothetical protein